MARHRDEESVQIDSRFQATRWNREANLTENRVYYNTERMSPSQLY